MTDRELLELAALAAGLNIKAHFVNDDDTFNCLVVGAKNTKARVRWSPLTDAGDALRLAVKLQLRSMPQEKCVYVESNPDTLLGFAGVSALEMYGADPCAATCRAITRAAAEIGKQMKEQTP